MLYASSLVAAAAFAGLASAGKGFTGKPVVSGYWPSYAAALLPASQIQYTQFTHIDWFVAETTPTYKLAFGGSKDIKTIVKMAHKSNVTVSMCVGGWTGSIYFSDLVANETARALYAKSMKSYMDLYGFDGIDLDWEFPANQGIGCNTIRPAEDNDNFLAFVKTLRRTVGPDVRLSAAVAVGGIRNADGTQYARSGEIAKYLDYITIMAYDVYGSWSATTGPVGPLYDTCNTDEAAGASGSSSVKTFTKAGWPANKLLLGIPAYSPASIVESAELVARTVGNATSYAYQNRTTDLAPGGVTSGPAGTDVCGTATPAGASWLFKELIDTGKLDANATKGLGDWERYWDACSQTAFLFNSKTREFIPYDDPQSFSAKAAYARKHGLSGINMFDLTGDTRDSKLIRAARSQLIGEYTDRGSEDESAVVTADPASSAKGGVVPPLPSSASRQASPPRIFSLLHALVRSCPSLRLRR